MTQDSNIEALEIPVPEDVREYRITHRTPEGDVDNGTRIGALSRLQADFPGEEWIIEPYTK